MTTQKVYGFVYYLQNPLNNEIFYVGCTQISLRNRLRTHYQHLREVERGMRKTNKRYDYLINLRPYKANICLLETVTDGSLQEREKHYIEVFRKLYPLTNMTDGGQGGHTAKYFNAFEKADQGYKISKANRGKAKPEGFAENLSKARTGSNNTMAGTGKLGWVICFNHDIPIRMFKFGFEVNNFLNSKHAWGNVAKVFTMGRTNHQPYDYVWKLFKDCDKKIQDIVEAHYESLG